MTQRLSVRFSPFHNGHRNASAGEMDHRVSLAVPPPPSCQHLALVGDGRPYSSCSSALFHSRPSTPQLNSAVLTYIIIGLVTAIYYIDGNLDPQQPPATRMPCFFCQATYNDQGGTASPQLPTYISRESSKPHLRMAVYEPVPVKLLLATNIP